MLLAGTSRSRENVCCSPHHLKQGIADCMFCLCFRYVALHRIQQVMLHESSKWMNVRIVKVARVVKVDERAHCKRVVQ